MAKSVLTFLLLFAGYFSVQSQNLSNKTIPLEVKDAVTEALSFFPELDEYAIEFKYRNKLKNRVMQAQPKIKTFFKGREKRHYKISMSKNLVMNDTTMTIDQLPHSILVGWFAHELGHVMDYKDRSAGNLIKFAFKYLTSKPFLKRSELRADALATDKGCGNHLIKTKKFILFRSKFPKEYKAKIKELYPSPEDITAMAEE
ncbi:hypothetical protein [Fulvivirga lutea]|uniref:Metalloprotease n=1 Tax=Fulvivirga lutea TaxID=2810512 RepID=A0A975A1J2_9BACT|nr:hypothetical protein [Fulvivirga lutea]QSE98305.1 hypothetical protein JR347_04285 [Fulvivirga lutea]